VINPEDIPIIRVRLHTLPTHYKELAIETKVSVLPAETLSKVEVAYKSFYEFISGLDKEHLNSIYKPQLYAIQRFIDEALASMRFANEHTH
jgi:hypothetical protein